MLGAALRGLDDDLAAREMDRRVVAAGGDRELGALTHLDERSVAQPQHRTRTAARAHGLAFPISAPGARRAAASAATRWKPPLTGLHGRAAALGDGEEGLRTAHPDATATSRTEAARRVRPQTPRSGCRGRRGRAPGKERQTATRRLQECLPAGHAIAEVVLDQERAPRTAPAAKGGQERHDVGATGDRLDRTKPRPAGRGDPLPRPLRRRVRHTRGRHVVAHGGDRVVQARFLASDLVSHRRPLFHCPSSLCRRCRVRCRLTATETREMPSMRAMSRLASLEVAEREHLGRARRQGGWGPARASGGSPPPPGPRPAPAGCPARPPPRRGARSGGCGGSGAGRRRC